MEFVPCPRLEILPQACDGTFGRCQFGYRAGQPKRIELIGVEGHDDHRSAVDPAEFPEASIRVGPLVHGDRCHGRVEAIIDERKVLGDRRHHGRRRGHRRPKARHPLGAHGCGRLDGDDGWTLGLVRTGPGTDVDHGVRPTQRSMDGGGDTRVGASKDAVLTTIRLVVDIASTMGHRGHEEPF
jgi:hypothetical protein